MRTSDKKFGEICDKVRTGDIDQEVMAYLESRVVHQEIESEKVRTTVVSSYNLKRWKTGFLCFVIRILRSVIFIFWTLK